MPVLMAAPLPILYGWRTTFAPAFIATSELPSVEPSSITMISELVSRNARIASNNSESLSASLKTGMIIEISHALTMELPNRIAPITKQACKMVGGKIGPQPLLGGVQIIVQESYEELVSHQEMCQAFCLELPSDIHRFLRLSDRPKKETGKVSAVVKIFSLTMINPPSDKEKINFRRR